MNTFDLVVFWLLNQKSYIKVLHDFLSIVNFTLKRFFNDFIQIFDDTISEAGHMATFCDSNNTAMIVSTKHFLHVHLRLNNDFIIQQFNASFVTTGKVSIL